MEELKGAFAEFGEVKDVFMPSDFDGNPRGFAFVQMCGSDDGEEAIARLNGQELGGRAMTVNEARSREDEGRGRPAGPVVARRSALLDAL